MARIVRFKAKGGGEVAINPEAVAYVKPIVRGEVACQIVFSAGNSIIVNETFDATLTTLKFGGE